MLEYIVLVKPYENPTLNQQEFVNELCTLITSYFMLTFSGWIPDDAIL
jgi:hypothetical protein